MDINSLKKQYEDDSVQEKVIELEREMNSSISSGNRNIGKISSDLSYYSELALMISNIKKNISDFENTSEMLQNEQDPELKEMASEELNRLESEILQLENEIKRLKISREYVDEDDSRSAILEIRAGAGGDEAALFAADLFRMYKNYSTSNNWNFEIIESHVTEGGGFKEVIAHISGKDVFKNLKYESGVHRVQRIPSTESSGRIHTSTASVAILPEANEVDVVIDPNDLRIDVMRASGAGGQCVNRTDSAVRITHIPTGIVVSCQETKHQQQNREKAMAILRSRLYDMKKHEEAKKRSDLRVSQIGSSMRAEKIRTYNFPQNRVTDHRVKISWHNLESILNGNIQEMINDIREEFQNQILAQETNI